MEWQHPEALYLILPLCAAWLILVLYSDRRRQRAREAFAARSMWNRVLPEESSMRLWVKLILQEIALIAGLVALAGPRFGTQYEQVVPRGSDLYVLIDVSRSMLADDVAPSRLGRAKLDVSALLNRLEGERVGLIAFAGQAVVKCPLTIDYDSFRRALEELDPDSAPRGGTAIGDAIRKALEVFQANSERDQSILLITDGDDQDSYPLEAAAVASERHVAIFAVGLGDAEQGARIPQKGASTFVEHQGQQVWSKLHGNLLQEIALKTSGVYVPAGTRTYDLAELYANHLQGRRGKDAAAQSRIRRSEQFQIFLAISLIALLVDLCIGRYRKSDNQTAAAGIATPSKRTFAKGSVRKTRQAIPMVMALILPLCPGDSSAAEADSAVREGLRFYSQDKFDEAREKFATATEQLDKQKSKDSAIASFDEACAFHRKGETTQAREAYLRAGLSQDRTIAVAAHFNLGTMSAEQARKLAGEHPEDVAPDKRQEVLNELQQAIVAYRHCLELQPDHAQSRRNLELVRQWIKYYSDQWRDRDRQKRRDESNLLQFLEFLIQSQSALREMTIGLSSKTHGDVFAEVKRGQDELRGEIPTLRDKIANELRPQSPAGAGTAAPQPASKEIEEGIALLQGWANEADDRMSVASRRLGAREPDKSVVEQQAAIDQFEKIWDAIIPFHPLLARDLADQTAIVQAIGPSAADSTEPKKGEANPDVEKTDQPPESDSKSEPDSQSLELENIDFAKLAEQQEKTLRRTRLLIPKAQAELDQLESAPAATPDESAGSEHGKKAQVDPEQVKAGLRKAIELAPGAVSNMEDAINSIKEKDRPSAAKQVEEARRILEEIQKAQPKNDQKQDQDQKNDQNQDKQDQQQKKDGEDQKKDKQDEKKDDKNKSEEEQKKQEQQQKKQDAGVSQDRVEEALRKVRERQQEKRERDRKLKGMAIGKTPVDKDW